MPVTFQGIARVVTKLVQPLRRRVRLMVARGIVELVDDSKKFQSLQVTVAGSSTENEDEPQARDETERFQQYGVSSHPSKDAEALCLAVGGNPDHVVVICVDDRRYRPTGLEEGEVVLYTKGHGILLKLDKDGKVHLGSDAASDALALASKVDARVDTLQAAHDGHIHITTATVGPSPTPGTIAPTASPVGALDTTASEKVLAE